MYRSDLGLLKRDKALQARYNVWIKTIKVQYGTVGESGLLFKYLMVVE